MAKSTPAEPTPDSEPAGPPRWRYVGDIPRIYTTVPVTAAPGDVIAWPTNPGTDGRWEATTDPATRQPDNHRTEE